MDKTRSRNAEASKERILNAAFEEFAARGVAGARVDRIADAAGCNKNLIYIYFGGKEALFTTVLRLQLTRVYDEVPFTPDDLSGYGVRVFDFAMDHPQLMRMMAWFALEQATLDSPAERQASFDVKLEHLESLQAQGEVSAVLPSRVLIVAIMSLATAWSAISPFGPSLDPDGAGDREGLRRLVASAIARLVAP